MNGLSYFEDALPNMTLNRLFVQEDFDTAVPTFVRKWFFDWANKAARNEIRPTKVKHLLLSAAVCLKVIKNLAILKYALAYGNEAVISNYANKVN